MRQGEQKRSVVIALVHLASFGTQGNEELIKAIVANGNSEELEWVAYIDSLSDEMFLTLSKSRVAKVRAALASNRRCPLEILRALAKDDAVTVKRAAESNLKDYSLRPKVEVARDNILEDAMAEFSLHLEPSKIETLCSSDVAALFGVSFLDKLVAYPRITEISGRSIYRYVSSLSDRQDAFSRLSPLLTKSQISDILAQQFSYSYGNKSFSNEELLAPFVARVDADFIAELAESDSNYLRRVAARSELIEAEKLDHLALNDNANDVVKAARDNPKISRAALLDSCLRDRQVPDRDEVGEYVARFGESFLDELLDRGSVVAVEYAMRYKISTARYSLRKVLLIAARSADDKVRLKAVKMEEIGPNTLKRLIYDSVNSVRMEALSHKSTRVEDLIAYSLKNTLGWSNMVRFSDEELMQVGAGSIFSALSTGNLNASESISTNSILRGRLNRLIFGRIKSSGLDRPEVLAVMIGLAEGYGGSIGELLDSVASLSS